MENIKRINLFIHYYIVGNSKAIEFLLEDSPEDSDNTEQLFQAFDSIGLDNMNALVEMEWLIALNDLGGYSNSKSKDASKKWFCDWVECKAKLEAVLQRTRKSFDLTQRKPGETIYQIVQSEFQRLSAMVFRRAFLYKRYFLKNFNI